MNRTISFRAWDKKRASMFEIQYWDFLSGAITLDDGEELTEADVEIMQFTGLTDKNGKEIYEGDIARVGKNVFSIGWDTMPAAFRLITTAPATNVNGTYQAGIGVPVRGAQWVWGNNDTIRVYWPDRGTTDDIEVIGNIYENPELLNHA